MRSKKITWLLAFFCLFLGLYSIFSYSFTDPNLVLVTLPWYWSFQSWMWQNVFANKVILVSVYGSLIIVLFVLYLWIIRLLKKHTEQRVERTQILIYGLVIACLLFSYNALSHDVFNYIFNAKLAVVYQEDPHVATALQYSGDDWTRFMHNTHTQAPYGYGWTLLSFVPFSLGNQVFSVTWMLFRLFQVLAIFGLYKSLQALSKPVLKRELYLSELAVVFLNPLFLIEIVSSMHNDLWMIFPAVAAVAVALQHSRNFVSALLLSGLLLALSISIKFATIVLIPVVVLLLVQRTVLQTMLERVVPRLPFSRKLTEWVVSLLERWIYPWVPLVCSVALFLPLFLSRSQYFHPWYLVWSLSWLPLIKQAWWRQIILAFSFSSLLRYLPWIWVGGFEAGTVGWQRLITWITPLVLLVGWRALGKLVVGRFESEIL